MQHSDRKERLAPPLMLAFRSAHDAKDAKKRLDLRDSAGDRIIASRRVAPRQSISEPVLRQELANDLEALMNTVGLESSVDLEPFEYVRKSVLNYGIPDIAHRSSDETSIDDIKDEIEIALAAFEPRLIRDSIQVSRDRTVDSADLKVRFIIRADLLCQPVNVPVEFVAEVELDSTKFQISRL